MWPVLVSNPRPLACDPDAVKKPSFCILTVSFSIFKLFRLNFEAILLSLQGLLLFQVILINWAYLFRAILWLPIGQVMSSNQWTQESKRRINIRLDPHCTAVYEVMARLRCSLTVLSVELWHCRSIVFVKATFGFQKIWDFSVPPKDTGWQLF